MTNTPILCFSKFSTRDRLLLFARAEGKKWRAKFLRKIKDKQYGLTGQREIFRIDGVCALFNAANLRVAYFSERLSGVLSLLKGECDVAAFQRIHDQVSARFLPKTNQEHGVQLPQFWMLLLELLENGFLVEEQAGRAASEQGQARINRFTSLIIVPSLNCNYRCDYCYHRDILRSRKALAVLTSDKLRRGIDYFLANTSVPLNVSRSIRFTGGEPALHYDLVREALEYAAEIRLRAPRLAPFMFSMVTNASLITDRWTELIKRHGIAPAVSLDGIQPRNDLRRKRVKGSAYLGSTGGIQRLNEAGIQPTLFITVSSHNIDTLAEDVIWLYEHFQFAAFSFNLDTSFMMKYRVAPAEYTLGIIKAYTELSQKGLFDLKATRINRRFQSKKSSVSGCGGIFSHMALFPDGSVGPCPRLAGDATHRMDIVEGRELLSSELFHRWSAFDFFQNSKCQGCNYRNICEGWCPYASMQLTGRISEPNEYSCLFTKTMLEWLIRFDCAEALKGGK